jgi:O-antigen biosynthesis protein WbqP
MENSIRVMETKLQKSKSTTIRKKTLYSAYAKRWIDFMLSAIALVVLSWLYLLVYIAIKIDDPGPALFRQKRVGRKKNGQISYFMLAKFRSMKMSTPHDVPTHMLENPDQYITRVGRFLRKSSLDEMPQIAHILTGKMSIIGPRPALWNQYDLVAEREQYGANDITPGLTGWAQINGRDELKIEHKALLDGEYVEKMSLRMDCRCFFGTIVSVLQGKGVVEGCRVSSTRREDRVL